MKTENYFLLFCMILLQLSGILWYTHHATGLLFAFQAIILLALFFLGTVAVLTIGFDTRLPYFAMIIFFAVSLLDALMLYFSLSSIRLFAALTGVGSFGVIYSISLLEKVESQRKKAAKIKKKQKTTKSETAFNAKPQIYGYSESDNESFAKTTKKSNKKKSKAKPKKSKQEYY